MMKSVSYQRHIYNSEKYVQLINRAPFKTEIHNFRNVAIDHDTDKMPAIMILKFAISRHFIIISQIKFILRDNID